MSKPTCRRCGSSRTTRRERKTRLERTLFTWLGIYPWECNSCWKPVWSRIRGVRRKRSPDEGSEAAQNKIAAD